MSTRETLTALEPRYTLEEASWITGLPIRDLRALCGADRLLEEQHLEALAAGLGRIELTPAELADIT
jgi:hypothetical protein